MPWEDLNGEEQSMGVNGGVSFSNALAISAALAWQCNAASHDEGSDPQKITRKYRLPKPLPLNSSRHAIVQILWVSIKILIRAARHLAISQLEIAVVAFAPCAISMNVLSWYKPKGLEVPITIMQFRGEAPRQVFDGLVIMSDVGSSLENWTTIIRTKLLGRPAEEALPSPTSSRVAMALGMD
jgi:hypothetical protein